MVDISVVCNNRYNHYVYKHCMDNIFRTNNNISEVCIWMMVITCRSGDPIFVKSMNTEKIVTIS